MDKQYRLRVGEKDYFFDDYAEREQAISKARSELPTPPEDQLVKATQLRLLLDEEAGGVGTKPTSPGTEGWQVDGDGYHTFPLCVHGFVPGSIEVGLHFYNYMIGVSDPEGENGFKIIFVYYNLKIEGQDYMVRVELVTDRYSTPPLDHPKLLERIAEQINLKFQES